MINSKPKKLFILSVIVFLLWSILPVNTYADVRHKSSLLNYNLQIHTTGKGSLYWDYGEKMVFFLQDGIHTYSKDCKVRTNHTYKFSKAFDRSLIPLAESGYYLAGFYDESGRKVNLTKTKIDILRVSIDGIYYYDYYDSYENTKYKNYTEEAYKKIVKAYLKALYGTTRYKKIETITRYKIPKKDVCYTAKFVEKKSPAISVPTSKTKTYGDKSFYVLPQRSSKYTYTFKSSNTKVVTVNKSTGYVTIKAPGTAKVTCTVGETETTLPKQYVTDITVNPAKVTNLQGKQKKKTLTVSWKKQTKNTGYEIEASNNTSFQTILVSKVVRSSTATSTKLSLKTELFHNYVRIRAYKQSGGKKIYGAYTIKKIAHN